MRTLALSFAAALIALWVIPFASAADGDPTPIGASLAAGGTVPKADAPEGAGGLFSGILTTAGGTTRLAWSLDFSGLSGAASAAHIHFGAPGTAGDIAVELCAPCTTGAKGQATLDEKTVAAIGAGEAYVNIHTAANAKGEVRGQIAPAHAVTAALVTAGQVPPVASPPADAKGAFKAVVIDLPKRSIIAWSLSFSGLSGEAQAAHIHIGAAGTAGPVAIGLCQPCAGSQSGRREIKPSLSAALKAGPTYVNVHTAANPGGEIRGQNVHATLGVAIRSTPLGTIVTDDRGMTLYNFAADRGTTSNCYGACATFWPPAYLVGTAVAGTGTQASLLGSTTRTDGTTMLTYNGQPLYGFLRDTKAGDTVGQGSRGFGAPWLVIDPVTGKAIGG